MAVGNRERRMNLQGENHNGRRRNEHHHLLERNRRGGAVVKEDGVIQMHGEIVRRQRSNQEWDIHHCVGKEDIHGGV